MDKSELFIKQCDCEEVQEYRRKRKDYQVGDVIANHTLGEHSKAILLDVIIFEQHDEIRHPQLAVWLPMQHQIQGMIRKHYAQEIKGKRSHDKWFPEGDIGLSYVLEQFTNFFKENILIPHRCKSFEQLWLSFYMWEKHEKVWISNKEKWVK